MSAYPTGCTSQCNGGADCTEPGKPCQSAAPEGGNVYFDTSTAPKITSKDALGVLAILAACATVVIYLLVQAASWMYPSIFN